MEMPVLRRQTILQVEKTGKKAFPFMFVLTLGARV
jgi:hypothetical protein